MQKQTSTNLVRIGTAALVAVLVLTQPFLSFAFKPITHAWIAQQIVNELHRYGNKVVIDGKEYIVEDRIANAIKLNPDEYRMGFIGPDAFPDVVVGQMTMHPGDPANPKGWQSDTWLRELLKASDDDEESRSFAYGYIGHAASDIFAHTYVNTYSGDVFELKDPALMPKCEKKGRLKCLVNWAKGILEEDRIERRYADEEKRHFALESFIAKYTPPILNHQGAPVDISTTSLAVPKTKVADFFMRNTKVREAYDDQWFAWHLLLMAAHRDNVKEIADRALSATSASEMAKLKSLRDVETAEVARLTAIEDGLSGAQEKEVPKRRKALKQMNELIKKLDELSVRYGSDAGKWVTNIDTALDNYIEMGRQVAIELTRKNGRPKKHVEEWRKRSLPLLLNPSLSKRILQIQDILTWLERVSGIERFKEVVEDTLRPLKEFVAIAIVRGLFGRANGAMLKVVYRPDDITDEDLDKIFSTEGARKKLLLITDMSARAKYDMGATKSSTFDPGAFSAVRHAVTLAKLSLLGSDELNRLIRRYDPESRDVFAGEEFNILFGAVRSIDGDHQWNEFAPRYLRRDGSTCEAPLRRYGYGENGNGEGFKLWTNGKLRVLVFQKLFPTMIAPGMYDHPENGFSDLVPKCYRDRYNPTEGDPFPVIK